MPSKGRDIEFYTSLRPRGKIAKSDEPKVTLAKKSHNALYFNAAASKIIKSQPKRFVMPGLYRDTVQMALRFFPDDSTPGVLPVVQGSRGFQVGGVRDVFEEYGLTGTDQEIFDLEWNEKEAEFLFDAPFALGYIRRTRSRGTAGHAPAKKKMAR